MGGPALILLDTHVLLWLNGDIERIGEQALATIGRAEEGAELAYSAITLWEIGMLLRKDRLRLARSLTDFRREWVRSGLEELSLTGSVAIQSNDLPGLHGDPADRFIVATALLTDATLVTADERILGWSGPLRRQDARL